MNLKELGFKKIKEMILCMEDIAKIEVRGPNFPVVVLN